VELSRGRRIAFEPRPHDHRHARALPCVGHVVLLP
jgi:hypothetical protein